MEDRASISGAFLPAREQPRAGPATLRCLVPLTSPGLAYHTAPPHQEDPALPQLPPAGREEQRGLNLLAEAVTPSHPWEAAPSETAGTRLLPPPAGTAGLTQSLHGDGQQEGLIQATWTNPFLQTGPSLPCQGALNWHRASMATTGTLVGRGGCSPAPSEPGKRGLLNWHAQQPLTGPGGMLSWVKGTNPGLKQPLGTTVRSGWWLFVNGVHDGRAGAAE